MKKACILGATIILAFVHVSVALAYETDFDDLRKFDRSLPAWKFGRGVVNIMAGPYELLTTMTNAMINGQYNGSYDNGLWGSMAGSMNGFIAGTFTGSHRAVQRMTRGCLEILTFWKPEYGPTLDPEYGTRNRAFTDNDYFDPNPFWYYGPPRE